MQVNLSAGNLMLNGTIPLQNQNSQNSERARIMSFESQGLPSLNLSNAIAHVTDYQNPAASNNTQSLASTLQAIASSSLMKLNTSFIPTTLRQGFPLTSKAAHQSASIFKETTLPLLTNGLRPDSRKNYLGSRTPSSAFESLKA
jgi:hypothetical protein